MAEFDANNIPPHKRLSQDSEELEAADGDASSAPTMRADSSAPRSAGTGLVELGGGAVTAEMDEKYDANADHVKLEIDSSSFDSRSGSDESLEKGGTGLIIGDERLNGDDSDGGDSDGDASVTGVELPEGGSKLWGASGNFINTVIGVGIITLGQTLKISGAYFGMLLMIFCIVLTGYTSWLMINTGRKYKPGMVISYGTLCRHALGGWAFYLLSIMNFAMMLGVLMSYAIVFRQVMAEFVSSIMLSQFQYDWALLLVVAVGIMLPLSLLKDMEKLSFTSLMSTVMVLTIVIIVCVRAPAYHGAMVRLTPEKMRLNEMSLSNDRALFVCGYARNFHETGRLANPFLDLPESETWNSTKSMRIQDEDLRSLYGTLAVNNNCKEGEVDTKAVQEAMDAEAPVVTMGGTTKNVTESIGEAHANLLYTRWSINDDKGFNEHTFARPGAFVALGVFGSAFITQQVVFSIYNSLRERTNKQWRRVVVGSSAVVTAFCLTLSLVGFFCFTYQSRGQVFETMKPRFLGMGFDIATNIAQCLLLFTIALTYPMQLYSGRVAAIEVFEKICEGRGWSTARDHPNYVHITVSVIMWGLSVLIGILVDDMVYVFGMIGAVFASPMIYILPVGAHFGQQGGIMAAIRSHNNNKNKRTFCWEVICPMFVGFFGFIILVLTPIFTTTEKFNITHFDDL